MYDPIVKVGRRGKTYGKRSADAEPEADAALLYGAGGLGYAGSDPLAYSAPYAPYGAYPYASTYRLVRQTTATTPPSTYECKCANVPATCECAPATTTTPPSPTLKGRLKGRIVEFLKKLGRKSIKILKKIRDASQSWG